MDSLDRYDASAADEPHPEIQPLLVFADSMPVPDVSALSPDGAREFIQEMVPAPEEPEPVDDVLNLLIGDDVEIPVRVYVPDGEPPYAPIVYIHGGGWVLGTLDETDPICRRLTNETGRLVVSVDYRRAPEVTFPTPLEDCYAATKWVSDNAADLVVDEEELVVMGDSAGGNLSAGVALLARDRDGPSIARQVLIYPVIDRSFDTPSYEENSEGYLLTRGEMQYYWEQRLDRDIDAKNRYAAPLLATDLSGLPPSTVVTCGFDVLRDEGAEYARRLDKAGVDVTFRNYDDGIHGVMDYINNSVDLTLGREIVADVADDLTTA